MTTSVSVVPAPTISKVKFPLNDSALFLALFQTRKYGLKPGKKIVCISIKATRDAAMLAGQWNIENSIETQRCSSNQCYSKSVLQYFDLHSD